VERIQAPDWIRVPEPKGSMEEGMENQESRKKSFRLTIYCKHPASEKGGGKVKKKRKYEEGSFRKKRRV